MSSSAATAIAILGGGPIGLVTGMLLARAGFSPTVFDARRVEETRGDRRLLALSRGTWQVLAPMMGEHAPPVAPIVDVHVSSAGEFGATHLRSRDLGRRGALPGDPLGEALGVTVYYGELMQSLAAAASTEPGLAVLRPVRVSRVNQRFDAVDLELDADTAAPTQWPATLAVHAEGSPGNAARNAAAVKDWALLSDLELRGPAPGCAFERFTREGPLALLPAPTTPGASGPRWSLVWCMGESQAQRRGALGEAAFAEELQRAIGPRIARLVSCTPRRAVPLPQQARDRIVEHRVVWIGNAAQTLHPVAGQGLNLGLRDALTLVDCLSQRRSDPPAALADYSRRRSADRSFVRGLTLMMPPLFATRALPVALARSVGLTAMDLLPPLRREWARLLMFGVRN